ncbi:MAG: hypothetical protein WCT53_03185 [Candidatus Gracilibacteria bacterium]
MPHKQKAATPPEQTEAPKVYNPTDVYLPLTRKDATQDELVMLLFRRTSPFLPTHVLTPQSKRFMHASYVQRLFNELQRRYVGVLMKERHSQAIASKVESGMYTDVPRICENIADGVTRDAVFPELRKVRDNSTCDFLAALGFEPPKDIQAIANAGSEPDGFRFYNEVMSSLNDKVVEGKPDEEMEPEELRNKIKLLKLREWIGTTNNEFQQCIAEAYEFLSQSIKPIAPHGIKGQEFGMITDLGTQSFAGLLTIVFNKKTDINIRFEALRLLEWAIAFYSIKTNPVFKAQQAVRAEMHEKFQMFLWASDGEFLPMTIPGEWLEKIMKEEGMSEESRRRETDSPSEDIQVTARKIGNRARRALSAHNGQVINNDRLMLETRGKTHQATAAKLFIRHREINEARATVGGMKTSISLEKATSIIEKYKRRALDRGHTEDVFNVKPASFDVLDDQVGGTLIVNLAKPIDELTEAEKPKVLNMFSDMADFVAVRLGLRNVRKEADKLFSQNLENDVSSDTFRVYKLHGTIEVQVPVHENNCLVMTELEVPVEIQLVPLVTYLRGKLPGKSGHSTYKNNQIRDLGVLLMPDRIGSSDLYPGVRKGRRAPLWLRYDVFEGDGDGI